MTPLNESSTRLRTSQISVPQSSNLALLIDPKIYLNCANAFTGKLFFNLSLISFNHKDGSSSSVHLTYNPLQPHQGQLDLGFGLGISKNFVNYDPYKKQYSITIQGAQFLLNQKNEGANTKSIKFSISNSSVVVLMDPSQATFRIFKTGGASQAYQKIDGADINSWHLTEESLSKSDRLTYSYNIDHGDGYLKEITHSDQQQLIRLSYKTDAVFKLASVEIHAYNEPPAILDFGYDTQKITLIERGGNPFGSYTFKETSALIETIALPTLQIQYDYVNQDDTQAVSANHSYHLRGIKPRIFYGPDYLIGTFIDSLRYLILEKCSKETFKIEASGQAGYAKRYPTMSLNGSSIESYSILAMEKILLSI